MNARDVRRDMRAAPAFFMLPAIHKRKRDQRVRRLAGRVRALAPHLGDEPIFTPLLHSFCRVSILLSEAYEVVRAGAVVDEKGELRASVDTIRRLAEAQARLARELGLTPATLKQFKREKRADLAGELADGDEE